MMIPNMPCTIDLVMSESDGKRLIRIIKIIPAMNDHIKASKERMLSFRKVSFMAFAASPV